MKRPLAFLLLIIALAWLLHWNDINLTGAHVDVDAVCGNHICEHNEDNNNCPSDCEPYCGNLVCETSVETNFNCAEDCEKCGNNYCAVTEDANECDEDCDPICGNNVVEEDEECDGIDDGLCPELCRTNCNCPPEEQRDINVMPYTYTFAYDELKQNQIQTIDIGRPNVDIMRVNFVASATLHNPKFIIVSNTSAPPVVPNGTIHSYFKLQISNLSQEQYLAYVEIFFRVPTEWTIENNVRTVQLERADAVWQALRTEKLYQDMDYVYFSAKSTKLGLFATVAPPVIIPVAVCGNDLIEEGEDEETCCADVGCPAEMSCISNKCIFAEICGNNICEINEDARTCPQDCASARFKPSAAPALVLLMAILTAVLLFLYKKLPPLYTKTMPVTRKHATPELWSSR